MTCVYDAPAEKPAAPGIAADWRGPNGYALVAWEADFRAGGSSRLRLLSPEGNEHFVEGVHLEIAEPERVVFTGDLGFTGGPVTFRRV
jgi:uncharacterized protein YndB with AHSA1/START domain